MNFGDWLKRAERFDNKLLPRHFDLPIGSIVFLLTTTSSIDFDWQLIIFQV
jgi:hypothetical protein